MTPVRHPLRLAALAALVVAIAGPGTASAQVTIGEVATPAAVTPICVYGPYDTVPSGPTLSRYTVPTAGVITSWSNQSAAGNGQQLTFKVFRPVGYGPAFPRFQVVAENGPRSLAPEALNTFAVEIPVEAGEVIGNNDVNAETVNNACVFKTTEAADSVFWWKGSVPAGEVFEAGGTQEKRQLNMKATLLAPPTISAVTPSLARATGGTVITITGTELADVRGLTIGSVPVPFAVDSETTITATTPVGTAGAEAPVTVTTIAGTASRAFAYKAACKVPKLRGRNLNATRKALRKAHCKLGKVTRMNGVTAKRGRVVRQHPKRGASHRAGAKVSVTLG